MRLFDDLLQSDHQIATLKIIIFPSWLFIPLLSIEEEQSAGHTLLYPGTTT